MGILEGLFPEMMEAEHLRSISSTLKAGEIRARSATSTMIRRMNEMNLEIGSMALILAALVEKLVEDGVLSKEELLKRISDLDALDGRRDGKLDTNVARGVIGAKPPLPEKKFASVAKKKKRKTPRVR